MSTKKETVTRDGSQGVATGAAAVPAECRWVGIMCKCASHDDNAVMWRRDLVAGDDTQGF